MMGYLSFVLIFYQFLGSVDSNDPLHSSATFITLAHKSVTTFNTNIQMLSGEAHNTSPRTNQRQQHQLQYCNPPQQQPPQYQYYQPLDRTQNYHANDSTNVINWHSITISDFKFLQTIGQ